jgi:hypothetical protein
VSRLATSRLLAVEATLTERERAGVEVLARLKLMSQAQMAVVLGAASPDASQVSVARDVRRILARLTRLGLLARLDRRVGGLRAGSNGYVYYLGPVGQRLVAYWQGRGLVRGRYRPEPGERYVRHRLAVSQLCVDLRAAHDRGELELLAFEAEPTCWRTSLDALAGSTILKPDAFVRVGLGAYEDRYFVEVDLGTESRSVIYRKLLAYLDYFHTGQEQTEHGIFPRVVILVGTEARQAALVDVAAKLPAEDWRLFVVNRLDNAALLFGGQIEADAHDDDLGDDGGQP